MNRYEDAFDWSDEPPKLSERELLEWAASFSPRAEAELRRLQWEEAEAKEEARRERELLEFVAAISGKPEHERELRALLQKEAEEREAQDRRRLAQVQAMQEVWDSSKHPRGAFSQNRGWWSPTDGSGSAAPADGDSTTSHSVIWRSAPTSNELAAPTGSDAFAIDATPPTLLAAAHDAHDASKAAAAPADWYVPSDDKGTWLGKKGKSTFRLKTPVDVNGKLVRDIEYHKGVPALDKFALPGKSPTIIMTGDRDTDVRHAKDAWERLNPGKKLPKNSTFHHDLLNATDHIEMVDGKKTKIVIGKMQLVPTKVNDAVSHQGTASVAKRFYEGLDPDTMAGIKRLSKEQASLAGTSKDLVARAAKKIKSGTIAKRLAPFVGRTVLRAIPLVGTGLAVLEFADNVEAHGLGGAVARATPVLGDLISAHDLGTDLAKQITDDANAKADAHLKALNASVNQAHEEATQQTLDAFRELAPKIKVTNSPEYGSGRLVDPQEVTGALTEYRNGMIIANHLRNARQEGFDYNAAAARNKESLKRTLERASQKRAPRGTVHGHEPMMRELLVRRFPILELLEDSHDPPLTSEAIEELEISLGVRFPRDYADFLLAFNGGDFGRNVDFSLPEPTRFVTGGLVARFYGEPGDGIEDYGLIKHAEVFSDRLPEDCLAIADCNGRDLVVLRFANEGSEFAGVWFWDSDAFWMDEDTPALHWLAETFTEFLSMLVYDVTAYEGEPESLPLFHAIQDGNFHTVQQYLAAGGDVEARNAEGRTILMAAAIYSWPRIVKLLLDQAADPNARDNTGQTPLHHAACHSIDSVKLLLTAGADAKARDHDGKSVLAEWSYRADQILRAHGAEE